MHLQERTGWAKCVNHALHAPLSTDKMTYYQLMSLVCEDLTANSKALDALVHGGQEATSGQAVTRN